MSPRHPGHDEQGRPIVAELGRAETPEETFARKAATSRAHREGKTWFALVGALLGTLGVVLFLVLVVARPDQGVFREPVDYATSTHNAQSGFDDKLVIPELGDEWTSNFARSAKKTAAGVTAWEIGFVSPNREFVQLTQAFDTDATWIANTVRDAQAGPIVELGGIPWTTYDRRDVEDAGNVAFALVAELDDRTIVVSGTARDADLETVAAATAEELP
ncbi:DUF4245 domain-containing protein [Salinibacterium sp. ZJ70]|uniref:DUF4245 domain-containing protein n=1 Tax=Salinibacterium sp. ZJ70 TaxID=2708084 RepID=UPI00142426DF|nr:DUF4245 domain-containing protein [Salinibacterium sp. ZJ70]